MKFAKYIKLCRKQYNLTQEKLIEELYIFDKSFIGLESRTISRWENEQTKPSINRIISIIQFFQSKSNLVLPCFEELNINDIEKEICKYSIKNMIGNSKEHILNFPSKKFRMEDITIEEIYNKKIGLIKTLDISIDIMQNLLDKDFQVSIQELKKLTTHRNNLFLISKYKDNFAGMFFALYLKPGIFDKFMNFEISIHDITINDIADKNTKGCSLPFAFFSINDKIATLLIVRYYAYLINNQKNITYIGTSPILRSGKKIIEKMNLQVYKSNSNIKTYKASLDDVLINTKIIKSIFQKQKCINNINTL